jgi:hypothetical protein
MACVPCQVIRWDGNLLAMVNTVDAVIKAQMAGGKQVVGEAWMKEWYEAVEKVCGLMGPVLDKVTEGDPGDQRR